MTFRSLRLMMSLTALASVAAATGCHANRCGSVQMSADAPGARGAEAPAQNAGAAAPSSAAAATRAVEEADIIQVDGGRLYAMSRASGLSVVGCGVERRAGGWNGEVGIACAAEVAPGNNAPVMMLYR